MSNARSQPGFLSKLTPGLANLLNYQRSNLSHDLIAGLSVAAVALPLGVAYAQLAGFNPELAARFRKARKFSFLPHWVMLWMPSRNAKEQRPSPEKSEFHPGNDRRTEVLVRRVGWFVALILGSAISLPVAYAQKTSTTFDDKFSFARER